MPPALQDNPFVLWLVLSAALTALVYVGMRPELRLRAALYGSFLLACLVVLWPPYDMNGRTGKIHLGLDLRGGMHIVKQVQTDEAINAVLGDAVHAAREKALAKGITIGSAELLPIPAGALKPVYGVAVQGIEPARVKDVHDFLHDDLPDWDVRESGEGRVVAQLTDGGVARLRERTVNETVSTLGRRVNALGVAEPVIAVQGARGDQILIQLPGVSDPEAAKRIIDRTAQLILKLVEDTASTQEALLQARGGKVPDNLEMY
jgi:preprotein translocase subunit SecD